MTGTHLYIILVSVVCGIIGAESRIGLSLVNLTKHPEFHNLSEEKRKSISKIPFRKYRYLIGSAAAYVSIVSLGFDLEIWQQTVMALLVSIGGSSFLANRIEGESVREDDAYLARTVTSMLERIRASTDLNEEVASGAAQEINDVS